MKRQRDIGSLPQAEQFHALGSVQGLSNASRRKVVNLYSSQDTGRRTQSRPGQIYRKAHGALREMTLTGTKGYVNFPYFSLAEILEAKVTACALFRASLSACCGEWNGGKVQLIVYVDECTAGNVVAPDPTRKACMVYLTILGMSLLHLESQWLTAALLRASDMQKVQGGLAQAIQVLLESWQEEWSTGILVSLDHGPQLLFVDRIILLADADGLRAATGCRGAAGNVLCARCANVRSHSAILSAPEGCVCITESNVSNFQLLSQARLDAILEELSSERTKKGLQDKETQVGWNFIPLRLSCLASRSLRAVMDITSVHFDPMHIYWSNGMIPQELGLRWSSLQDNSNVKISVLQEFVNMGWIAYKESNSQVLRLVGDKMFKRGADYRGNATQSMLCLCLCVQFQEEILRERLPRLSPQSSIPCERSMNCKHMFSASFTTGQKSYCQEHKRSINVCSRTPTGKKARGQRHTLVVTFRRRSADSGNCSTLLRRIGSIEHSRRKHLLLPRKFPTSAKSACWNLENENSKKMKVSMPCKTA